MTSADSSNEEQPLTLESLMNGPAKDLTSQVDSNLNEVDSAFSRNTDILPRHVSVAEYAAFTNSASPDFGFVISRQRKGAPFQSLDEYEPVTIGLRAQFSTEIGDNVLIRIDDNGQILNDPYMSRARVLGAHISGLAGVQQSPKLRSLMTDLAEQIDETVTLESGSPETVKAIYGIMSILNSGTVEIFDYELPLGDEGYLKGFFKVAKEINSIRSIEPLPPTQDALGPEFDGTLLELSWPEEEMFIRFSKTFWGRYRLAIGHEGPIEIEDLTIVEATEEDIDTRAAVAAMTVRNAIEQVTAA